MNRINCSNISLCGKTINKNTSKLYCNECLFYFNYKLEFSYNNISNNNINKNYCPICLSDNKILYIKQKNCDHFLCVECMKDIYFNIDFIKKMPINPIFKLRKSWNLFIYGCNSIRIKNKFLDSFSCNDFDDEIFRKLTNRYNHLIPNLFKNDFKDLIKFQLEKNFYIFNYKKIQSEKIELISKCPFCRIDELEFIDDFFIN